MNGYFGALIRSSALRIGHATPAHGADTPAGPVEISQEREVSRASAPADAPAHPERSRTVSETTIVVREAALERSPAPADAPASRPVGAPPPRPEASTPASPTRRPAPNDAMPAPAAATTVDPVRFAMQWVAADPGARAADTPAATPPLAAAPRVAHDPVAPIIIEKHLAVREPVSVKLSEAEESTGDPITPSPRVARQGRASQGHRTRDIRPADPVEEVVEISIGAINLHVEAPAPSTIVQPPPAPRAQPAAPQRAARSGLSRRYLRSF
jgi:hypothetical protein